MTRKEFMSSMLEGILGIKGIVYSNTTDNTLNYKTGGTFIKDCTYSEQYRASVFNMIIRLFFEEIKKVKIDKGSKEQEEDIKVYRGRAINFIANLIKSEDDNLAIIIEKLNQLSLSGFSSIYEYIIIFEIFNLESECSKERGDDDFQDSVDKITQQIKDYLERREKFFDDVSKPSEVKTSSMEIFYKSSMLRKYIDIEEYIKNKDTDLIDLNSDVVTHFKKNVVYKYCSECSFECDDDRIIVTILYNGEKISAFTSLGNWVNQSIISNYIYENKSRYCTCYFIYDQEKVFQFLQIGED